MKNSVDIPSELLDLVAFYTLLQHNSSQYSLVCQRFYNSFNRALYTNVDIRSRCQWLKFANTIRNNKILRVYIKKLCLQDNVGLSHQEIESLPLLFPVLEKLYFNPNLWKYQRAKFIHSGPVWHKLLSLPPLDCYSKTIPLLQNYGQFLQSISLSANLVNSLHITKSLKIISTLTSMFSMTPHLRHVTIYGCNKQKATVLQSTQRTTLSLTDIQRIHALLPMLECLELYDIALSIPSPSSEISLQQFTRLKKFCINGAVTHFVWCHFIAKLYPNLTDLHLNVTLVSSLSQGITVLDKEVLKNGLQQIAENCQYLKRVSLGQTSVSLGIEGQFFTHLSKKLTHHLVLLEEVYMNEMTFYGKKASSLFDSLMYCTSPTITETLRVQLWRDLKNFQYIMRKIGPLAKLTELRLTCGKFSYNWNYGCDINLIATYCPQLKVLELHSARLTSSTLQQEKPSVSKIEAVRLLRTHFTTESINMLASCCPNLTHLELIECVKDRDLLEQKVCIDFPNHHLSHMHIDKLYLRPNKFVRKSTIDIAFLGTNYRDRNQRHLTRSSSQANDARWYHLYSQRNKKTAGRTRRLRKLNSYECHTVENHQMKDKDWELLEREFVRGYYRSADFWKNDIPYGYVYISCNYVDSLKFNHVEL